MFKMVKEEYFEEDENIYSEDFREHLLEDGELSAAEFDAAHM